MSRGTATRLVVSLAALLAMTGTAPSAGRAIPGIETTGCPVKLLNFVIWDWIETDLPVDCPFQTLPFETQATRLRCAVTAFAEDTAFVDLAITSHDPVKSKRTELLRCAAPGSAIIAPATSTRDMRLSENTELHCEVRRNESQRPYVRGAHRAGFMFCSAEAA